MANLLPPAFQKKARARARARALLALSLALIFCGALAILALAPAEVALVSFSSPPSPTLPQQGNLAADRAGLSDAKALLSVIGPFEATSSASSVAAIQEALADTGKGISIDAISYSAQGGSITLGGSASSGDAANELRLALESDPRFSDVSIPVSALLGSQNGQFTISMNVTN